MLEIKQRIELLKNNSDNSSENLENLILQLGLNNEIIHEQPPEYRKYFGTGLKLWQYPNQLSKFGNFISNLKVSSYMEIGCRFGGTFIFNVEILRKNNQKIKSYACDLIDMSEILSEYQKIENFDFLKMSSASEQFKEFCKTARPEFVFIDGDHSYNGVKNDFLIFEKMEETKFIAFHDIVNDVCPGVVRMWQEVKECSDFETHEFVEQYQSVKGNYLGIGLAIRK